tara:strand:- start:387 stop:1454 length:1068 start_codon:yes stop_codon:yes gene_type:complete
MNNKEIDRQRYHDDLVAFSQKAFKDNSIYPKRYCFILTNLCNLACSFCFQDRKKQNGAMTGDDWIKLIDQLPPDSRVTLTGGEPIVFKDFKRVFDHVAKKFECNIITNGVLLSEELIDFMLEYNNFKVLSISIDNINNTLRDVKIEKWKHVEKMMLYFQEAKSKINHHCTLDSKTTILDTNASELLDIHKYCIDDLKCDTHAFQFLKGSPIQHSDIMFNLKTIFSESKAETYENWEEIVDQLKKVKEYNIKNKKYGFLHPPVASIMDEAEMPNIDYINNEKHEKNKFKGCSAPWSSVHVNVDGTLFPCLAISMGNVRDGLKNVLSGEKFNEFRKIIRENGTVEACNRCGWLQPEN